MDRSRGQTTNERPYSEHLGLEPDNKVEVLDSQEGGLPLHGDVIADAESEEFRNYSKASQEIGWLLTERMWVATHVHSWLRGRDSNPRTLNS